MNRIFLFLLIALAGCSKKETITPSAPATGKLTVFAKSDLGVGNIDIYINNTKEGTVTRYFTNGVTCGSGDVVIEKSGGTYSFTARGANGKTWGPLDIVIDNGACKLFELTNTNNSGSSSQPTNTTPDTYFIASQDYSVSQNGSYYTEGFTISQSTTFVLRFASLYKAQAAIIPANQLNAFKNMQAFTGYGLFDNTFGTKYLTLAAGSYYLAVRNTNPGVNKWSIELDKNISFPSGDRVTFYDNYLSDTKSNVGAVKTWQPFTIQAGYRYFIDGCNVNNEFFIISAAELAKFQGGGSFNSYTDYNTTTGFGPGLIEVKLQPGSYYLVSRSTQANSYTYVMERWKVN